MKKFIISSWIAICLLSCTSLYAQDSKVVPVSVSTEKVRMGDKLYYSHIVLEKQTLFSICKAYNVTKEEILEANKALELESKGLKKGQILLIPAMDPLEAKPSAKEQEQKQEQEQPQDKEEYVEHIAKWYETLGTVAFKYDVSVEILMAFNNLSSQKLTTRQIVKVPQGKTLERLLEEASLAGLTASEGKQESNTASAAENIVTDVNGQVATADSIGICSTDSVRVSLILPLGSQENINNSNYDFYSGVLIALKDLESEGTHTKLNVYNLDAHFPDEADLEGSDLIIGPVVPTDIQTVRNLVPESTAIISPLDPKGLDLAQSTAGVIQAPSSNSAQHLNLIKWVQEDSKEGDKIIMVTEKGVGANALAGILEATDMDYTVFSYGILEGRDITSSLSGIMTEAGTNRFIIASDKEAFVNDVIRNINLMIFGKFQVVLYAPSRMRSFETIEVENFHNSNMHLSSSYYVDYGEEKVKSFLMTYRGLCKAEPTPFAYQGYDIAYYFIGQFAKFGKDWMRCMEPSKGLQSNFLFEKTEAGGAYNTGVRRVVFGPDYSSERIR